MIYLSAEIASLGSSPPITRTSEEQRRLVVAQPTMTINGRGVECRQHFDVINPATEQVCGRAPDCTPEQLDQAFAAASEAFAAWSRLDAETRCIYIHAAADTLEREMDALAILLTTEQGKPLTQARIEIKSSVHWLRYFAGFRALPRGDPGRRPVLR